MLPFDLRFNRPEFFQRDFGTVTLDQVPEDEAEMYLPVAVVWQFLVTKSSTLREDGEYRYGCDTFDHFYPTIAEAKARAEELYAAGYHVSIEHAEVMINEGNEDSHIYDSTSNDHSKLGGA